MEDILMEKPPRSGQQNHPQTVAGIHLSGPNTPKTSVVLMTKSSSGKPFAIAQVYEKIGPKGNRFSDDRLSQILFEAPKLVAVVVDQPLSAPPCVSCQRSVCPGVIRCEDIGVASMMAVAARIKHIAHFKNQVINPQIQRLWDLLELEKALTDKKVRPEPTYQGHLAPLITRAQVLKKRLNGERPGVALFETAVKSVVTNMASLWELKESLLVQYRSFEKGLKIRQEIVRRILGTLSKAATVDPIQVSYDDANQGEFTEIVASSVENFHAFVCSWVGVLSHEGFATTRPETFSEEEGWVCLPRFNRDGSFQGLRKGTAS